MEYADQNNADKRMKADVYDLTPTQKIPEKDRIFTNMKAGEFTGNLMDLISKEPNSRTWKATSLKDNLTKKYTKNPEVIINVGKREDVKGIIVTPKLTGDAKKLYYKVYVSATNQLTWREAGEAQLPLIPGDWLLRVKENKVMPGVKTFVYNKDDDPLKKAQPIVFQGLPQTGTESNITHVKVEFFGTDAKDNFDVSEILEINIVKEFIEVNE